MSWSATNSEGYVAPAALAADPVVFTVREGRLLLLVIRRVDGTRSLPGGLVGSSEDPEETARRKLFEKTGVDEPYLEQLGTFARPGRDPRGWIPSISYLALVPPAREAPDPRSEWIPARSSTPLAFDHRAIVRDALERLEGKLWWSNIATGILPAPFTMTDARSVYEAIAGAAYDPATFARDLKATGLVVPTGEQRANGRGRPAALYRFATNRPAWGAGRRKRVAT
jgi:8-oxo-dGTP diphosphatase